ncbi:MAG: hypothetical protein H7311_06980 [Ramlibacter sp.]|nr:hypothetical protein [Cryobacterium sp.]
MKIWDWIAAPYPTPRRETLSYIGVVFYLACTTLCWDSSTLWPWILITVTGIIALVITGALLTTRDGRLRLAEHILADVPDRA